MILINFFKFLDSLCKHLYECFRVFKCMKISIKNQLLMITISVYKFIVCNNKCRQLIHIKIKNSDILHNL